MNFGHQKKVQTLLYRCIFCWCCDNDGKFAEMESKLEITNFEITMKNYKPKPPFKFRRSKSQSTNVRNLFLGQNWKLDDLQILRQDKKFKNKTINTNFKNIHLCYLLFQIFFVTLKWVRKQIWPLSFRTFSFRTSSFLTSLTK